MPDKSRDNHVLEAHSHETGTQGGGTFTEAKSKHKVSQTSEEQESHPTKGAGNPGRAEPSRGLEELGQARPELGQGPSSCPARPSSPQLGLVRLFSPRALWFFRRSFEVLS